ncbi:MAG: two-component regulator propeller domain-containing protein, partial [Bacteroidota bacterium]
MKINSKIKRSLFYNLILILSNFGFSFAQTNPFWFEQISFEEGLSQSTISSIIQDEKGFLWFGTDDGLNRYDGQFTVYKSNVDDPNSIGANQIQCLTISPEGNLWIGTPSGLNLFKPEEEKFYQVFKYPSNGQFHKQYIMSMVFDKQGCLWVGTNLYGFARLQIMQDSIIELLNSNDLEVEYVGAVKCCYLDSEGLVWIGTQHAGLLCFNKNNLVKRLPEKSGKGNTLS